ncbi:MAG: exodeoxyribonuclease VII large subunit [Planctomycetes bacterium]|nr:exodeoxyribonuclease VII large subunit [Planctomycetota bacterium]
MKENKDNQENILGLFPSKRKVLSVSELTRQIKISLEKSVGYVWICGELSNLRVPISGHHYFSLKDASAQIKCVLWKSTADTLKFKLNDGMEIIIFGRVTVYDKGGEYQIVADKLEPKGIGSQELALRQLKEKLQKEELFDAARKRAIPFLPDTIGIITSPRGAAIQDMLNIIKRRFPEMKVLIYPVKVQGKEAEPEIVNAFSEMNESGIPDVLILARGGGSTEDLAVFNSESVARAIYQSVIPVISAVGHEIDITIADLVADKRASTPSEAAELAVPVKSDVLNELQDLSGNLVKALRSRTEMARLKLDSLRDGYAFRKPFDELEQYRQRLDELFPRLGKAAKYSVDNTKKIMEELAGKLDALSPLKVLGRGYSVTMKAETKEVVASIKQIKRKDILTTKLSDGEFKSRVEEII